MPDKGEIRRGATESVQWDGSKWNPITHESDGVPMHHPGVDESPSTAFMSELARTGKEAVIGLLRSPLDLVKNTIGMVAHPIDTITNTAKALAHPSDTLTALENDPRSAGSLLGQLLMSPKLPGMAETAAAEGPGIVGRGMGTVGRGMEAAGNAVLDIRGGLPLGMTAAGTAASGHPIAAAAEIGVPLAAKYGGKGLQAAGRSLEGLKLATTPDVPPRPNSILSGVTLSPEAVARNIEATNLRDVEGYSHDMAGKLAGIPGAGKATVTNVPMGEHAITHEMINEALSKKPYVPWEPDPSELQDAETPSASLRGLDQAVSGRTTGQFEEGPGGLSSLAPSDAAIQRLLETNPNSALSRLLRAQTPE